MFERYSEKARRVIFFARFEASQYGSQHIETQHILLGLLREDRSLMGRVLGPNGDATQIRAEIEKVITRGERISNSVEVPLTEESKKILQFAADEATGLGQRYVGPEHLLLGILRVEICLAARILREKGVELSLVREQVRKFSSFLNAEVQSQPAEVKPQPMEGAVAGLNKFLTKLRSDNPAELALLVAKNAHVVDSTGLIWRGRDEIEKGSKEIFVGYAKKNVIPKVVRVDDGPGRTFYATVLWQNVVADVEPSKSIHLMTVILAQEGGDWLVFFLQVTPVVIT